MPLCKNCGAQIDEGAKFCTSCGAKQTEEDNTAKTTQTGSESAQKTIEDTVKKFTDTEDNTTDFSSQDINDNKVMAVLSYLSWLVLIPLIGSKSPYARFHVNQGLVLAIAEIVWAIVSNVVSAILYAILGLIGLGFIARIITALFGLVNLAFFVFSILGIVNAATGKAKRLPIVGNFNIIK